MPRRPRDSRIETRTARAKLLQQHEPYWRQISAGLFVGYRKGSSGGAWIARKLIQGRYRKAVLAIADDHRAADGKEVMDYGQAVQAAGGLDFDALPQNRRRTVTESVGVTVSSALDDWLTDYKARSGKTTETFIQGIEKHVRPKLGDVSLAKLTTKQIRDWHNTLVRTTDDPEALRASKVTANKQLTTLKAACNLAFRNGLVDSDRAWRAVRPFQKVDAPRVRFLEPREVKRLINASDPNFRLLVQAALLTGCRYGELIRMKAGDIGDGTVHLPITKAGGARYVTLTDEGQEFFDHLKAGRKGGDLLFNTAEGEPWGKSMQHRRIKEACARAKIEPAISFHILRHTYGAALARAGVPLQIIAVALGHADTRITEKHYAHLQPDHVAKIIRANVPSIGFERDNLVEIG